MKYALLIYPKPGSHDLPADERAAMLREYQDLADEDFVLDRHPAGQGIAFASACSGHGFKFSPVIGEILADLAIDGRTAYPVDTFRLDRFAA